VFLLAVTGALLLVRAALRSDEQQAAKKPAATVVRKVKTAAKPFRPPAISSVPKQYYVIQSGDTLDAVAAQFGTTTADILRLNPGVEPTALHSGDRVRVK